MWGKVHGFPWWPAQKYYRSGIEIIRKGEELSPIPDVAHKLGAAAASKAKISQLQQQSSFLTLLKSAANRSTAVVYLRFFLDESHIVMSAEQARLAVVTSNLNPFLSRSKKYTSYSPI